MSRTFLTAIRCGLPTARMPAPWSFTPKRIPVPCRVASPPSWSRRACRDSRPPRSSTNWECVGQNGAVPTANILGQEGHGLKVLMGGLDYERVVLAGGPLGIMAACMDTILPYVHERSQFGQPIGEFQLMQGKLADMYATFTACRAYVYAVAQACDRNQLTRKD